MSKPCKNCGREWGVHVEVVLCGDCLHLNDPISEFGAMSLDGVESTMLDDDDLADDEPDTDTDDDCGPRYPRAEKPAKPARVLEPLPPGAGVAPPGEKRWAGVGIGWVYVDPPEG